MDGNIIGRVTAALREQLNDRWPTGDGTGPNRFLTKAEKIAIAETLRVLMEN